MDNLANNANGDLEIDSGERAWETALISKESSRDENCTLRNCAMQWQSVVVLAGSNRLKIANKISIQTHSRKTMAIALPAAAVIMHRRVWHPIIAIKTFVVGVVDFRLYSRLAYPFGQCGDFCYCFWCIVILKIDIIYCAARWW